MPALQRTGCAGNLASSIQEILAEVDKDGDGRIDYQEFCDMMRGQACHPLCLPWHMFMFVPDMCLQNVTVRVALLLSMVCFTTDRNATKGRCPMACIARAFAWQQHLRSCW